tara:strand:- start:198 stop:473 length:276 start_codon:yes stop_codon:yes gene_type:complete
MGFSNRCRGGSDEGLRTGFVVVTLSGDIIVTALMIVRISRLRLIIHTKIPRRTALAEFRVDLRADPVLSLVVWTLKREVRAFGGCLGMYRR